MKLDWIPIEQMKPERSGWYAASIDPPDGSSGADAAGWRQLFGFSKLWFNDGRWWEACPDRTHRHAADVTDRVTHWAILPEVP